MLTTTFRRNLKSLLLQTRTLSSSCRPPPACGAREAPRRLQALRKELRTSRAGLLEQEGAETQNLLWEEAMRAGDPRQRKWERTRALKDGQELER